MMEEEINLDLIEQKVKSLMGKKEEPIKLPVPTIPMAKPAKKLPSNFDMVPNHVFGSHEAYYGVLMEMIANHHALCIGTNHDVPEYTLQYLHDIHDTMRTAQMKLNYYDYWTKGLINSFQMEDFLKKTMTPEEFEKFKVNRGKMLSKLLDPSYNPLKE